MQKIGIVTIISNNYGNRLQNYALQQVLKSLGLQVETIPTMSHRQLKVVIKKALSICFKKYKTTIWTTFDENIDWASHNYKDGHLKNESCFDYFVAGSDQIWNPLFKINSEREFLTFTSKEKRVAYAASIGLSVLPEEFAGRYREWLNDFKAVSVRENEAADIVDSLTGKRPTVVLDPTMLVSVDDWNKVIKKTQTGSRVKYIVKYFLGIRSEEYDEFIAEYAEEHNDAVIDITKINEEKSNFIGPSEFVYLIKTAEAVFTDSFHGSVFSILYHKPFLTFARPDEDGYGNMNSRIDTLFTKFDLMQKKITGGEQLIGMNDIGFDVEKVEDILSIERKKSLEFLKSALEG